MSSENKIPVNLYGILDNELARMHDLMRVYLSLPREQHMQQQNSYSYPVIQGSGMGKIYERITNMQDLLLQSLISHDRELQERIAELALTGVKKDEI